MPREIVDKRLRDALAACQTLAAITESRTLGDYVTDVQLRWAVERGLEIVGEAVNQAIKVDPAIGSLIPKAPIVVGLRNRIAHGYDVLKDDVVWDAVTVGAPVLAIQLETLLAERGQRQKEPPSND